ncbi:MAG TPA: N-6 DNA methylase, partial [Anaerolineales bacterium]|nr:N-6 DNA methylase [Anaerolineales bacterium]
GKASFFKGKFAKYGWSNIFDPRLGGVEMLALYGEAITNMSQNENLPQLFRDIFKNAFLPYRDPETLKLFLKTINEFTYDHSEKLGDAFEYLLSVLGSQGDAGQFRTPRHIIDFMVQVIGPKKSDTVLDPACGTAGFLISAYKYIVESNSKDPKGLKRPLGSGLNAQDKKRIYENFTGYDISPDMVRLSLVNMYLHGFVTPNIHEYDSLTSEERWNEYADVILANPPFMSPKGGIQPHKRFSVQSNRSEVLFVDYMAEHLTPNGRAAIIVPEGIIFQSAGAYKQLRKYLVENNYLWAVVSLPAGAFNPYSGVKTSILLLDKALAKKTDQILFVKVEADGFDLGAQRRPIDRNDLPDALNTLLEYQNFIHQTLRVSPTGKESDGKETLRVSSLDGKPASFSPTIASALLVATSRLAENEDYNLSADRYREATRNQHKTYSMVKLGEVAELVRGITFNKQDQLDYETTDSIRVATTKAAQEEGIIEEDLYFVPKSKVKSDEKLLQEGDILISTANSLNLLGRTTYVPKLNYKVSFGAFMTLVRAKTEVVNPVYLLHCLRTEQAKSYFLSTANTTTNISNLTFADLNAFQIPLPPLETQRQIVDEIAAHQRIIDGARQVVEGWKADIEVDPDWEIKNLSEICEAIMTGPFGTSLHESDYVEKGIPVINPKNIVEGIISTKNIKMVSPTTRNRLKEFTVHENDIVIGRRGEMGRC